MQRAHKVKQALGALVEPPLSHAAVAKAVPSGTALEGTNVAIAIFLPVLVVALLIGGVYLYFSK